MKFTDNAMSVIDAYCGHVSTVESTYIMGTVEAIDSLSERHFYSLLKRFNLFAWGDSIVTKDEYVALCEEV